MEAQSLIFGSCISSSYLPANKKNPTKILLNSRVNTTSFFSNIQSSSLKKCSCYPSNVVVNKKSIAVRDSLHDFNSEVVLPADSTGNKSTANTNIRKKNLAVFVSGRSSNFCSLHEATVDGSIRGDIVVLVTNNSECGGAQYARDRGVPVIMFPKLKDGSGLGLSSEELVTTLRQYKIDFIILAGYIKLIPAELVQAFPRSILNIHPSLLPAFGGKGYYGLKVHKAVIASGARYSGATVHYVDEEYDKGRILAQRIVPVLANDTAEDLASRVLHQEHRLYKDVVEALCDERITWREDGVPLIRSKENPEEYS